MSKFLDSKKSHFQKKKTIVTCFSKIENKNYHIDTNMRTKKLNFLERNIEQFIENYFFNDQNNYIWQS